MRKKASKKQRTKLSIWKETNGFCVYCNRLTKDEDKTLDHIFPKSRGGTFSSINLVPSCRWCNVRRGTRMPASSFAHKLWEDYLKSKEIKMGLPVSKSSKRLVRLCAQCGSKPIYSLHLKSEWISCPNKCTIIFVKGGDRPEKLEELWNRDNEVLLLSRMAETPYNEFYDPLKH